MPMISYAMGMPLARRAFVPVRNAAVLQFAAEREYYAERLFGLLTSAVSCCLRPDGIKSRT